MYVYCNVSKSSILFTARTQPIIASSTPDMIKDHFLPIAIKLRENGKAVDLKDKKLLASKHGSNEVADLEAEVQTVNIFFFLYIVFA